MQHKKILERTIPDALKLSIARKIENNLFSKVCYIDRKLYSNLFQNTQSSVSDFFFAWTQRDGRDANSFHGRGCIPNFRTFQ
jgi:hypothetical protein